MRGAVCYAAAVGCLAGLYLLLSMTSLRLFAPDLPTANIWPPAGLVPAVLLLFGWRLWPGVALGALAAALLRHAPLPYAAGSAAAETIGGLVAVLILTGALDFRVTCQRAWDVAALIVVAGGLATLISTLLAMLALGAAVPVHGRWTLIEIGFLRWLGDFLGTILVAPLILVWVTRWREMASAERLARLSGLLALLTAVAAVAFGQWGIFGHTRLPLTFLVVPVVIWIAFRMDLHGVTAANVVVAAIAAAAISRGAGPFSAEGAMRSVALMSSFVASVGGTALILAAVVSERRRSQGGLLQSQASLRHERDLVARYLDIAEVILLVLDPSGRVRLINRKGCEVVGRPAREIVGADWMGLTLPQRLRESNRDIFARVMAGQAVLVPSVEVPLVTAAGHERLIVWRHALLRNEDGRIDGLLSSGEDATDRRAAEEGLRRADELKADFIRVAGHELRTPVSYILGLAHLLHGSHDADRLSQAIEGIADRAGQLNDILLAMFKLMPGELRPERLRYANVNLADVLKSARQDAAYFLAQRQIRMSIEWPDHLPPLRADPGKLHDMVANLLSNAIKFTPDGGEIRLTAALADAGHVCIAVADQGPGVSPDDLPHLFKPFFSGGDVMKHSTGTWKHGKAGMGLGLTIVKQFAEMHGGAVTVQTGPGGSIFTIILPLNPTAHAPPEPSHAGAGAWI